MVMSGSRWLVVVLLVIGTACPAAAQDAGAVGWFACPYVDWWEPPTAADCPRPAEDAPAAALEVPPSEAQGALAADDLGTKILEAWLLKQAEAERAKAEGTSGVEAATVEAYPLFPPESLAPDAPDLFAELLAQPAIDKAKAYWLWYEERQARLIEVQKLIAEAGRQIAIERGLPVGEYETFFLDTHGAPESLTGEAALSAARQRRGATLDVMRAGQLPLVPPSVRQR